MNDEAGAVLVVDDDAGHRDLMAGLLEEAGFRVRTFARGEEALDSVAAGRPAAVVLDVHLSGMSGYEACHRLRERFGEDLAIVFVSGKRAEAIDRVAGLLLGADDYITKPFSPDELVARVRRLVARARPPAGISNVNGHADVNGAVRDLTEREREVLTLLAEGLDQEAVAEELVISSNTVATHIQRILAKLGARSRAQAIAHAYRDGILGPHPIPTR